MNSTNLCVSVQAAMRPQTAYPRREDNDHVSDITEQHIKTYLIMSTQSSDCARVFNCNVMIRQQYSTSQQTHNISRCVFMLPVRGPYVEVLDTRIDLITETNNTNPHIRHTKGSKDIIAII